MGAKMPGEFVKVAKLKDIPKGSMKGVNVKGSSVLIANIDGKIYAASAVCTHLEGALDEGELSGKEVTCPLHGSVFNVTDGSVVNGPAEDPIKTFKVKVEGEDILISPA